MAYSFYSWLMVGIMAVSQTSPSREYQIKAVFLFNFTQFVEWPEHTFSSGNTPFVIGILGSNPFNTYLDEMVQGEKVNGRTLVVQRYTRVEDIKECHILYISPAAGYPLKQVISALKGKSVLTVSDAPDFIFLGGMIRFVSRNNKTQIQINPELTKGENLIVSSKLLRLAEIVSPEIK